MEIATKKYENHLFPLNLKKPFYEEALLFTVPFEFEEVNLKDIEKEILNLNTKYLKKRLASIALCFSKYGTMKF